MDKLLITYALSMIGVPYLYGGSNPITGFDCSGLVVELMKAGGLVGPHFDANAQMLYDMYQKTNQDYLASGGWSPALGHLAFYGKSPKEVTHVAFCLSKDKVIEAGGGDRTTTNRTIAADQDAFVKIRPLKYRKDLLGTLFVGF